MQYNPHDFKILIVDDLASNIYILKLMLENAGYQTNSAESGEEALQKAKEWEPDLVLLDILMPGMGGYEVAQKIREIDQEKQISIIFITVLTGSKNIVDGYQHGGNDYITKPFIEKELLLKVKHQLSLHAAKRQIKKENIELQEVIKSRDTLYSVIAHDLRSPLSSLKMTLNTLSFMLTEDQIGKDLHEMVNLANHTTDDLFNLLDNLLKWSKSKTGNTKVVFQQANIVELIEGVVCIFQLNAHSKKIQTQLIKPIHEKLMVVCDIDMVKTILRNLLSNAFKFSHPNTTVKIQIEEQDTNAVISISDQGIGMTKEQQQKLLDHISFTTFGTNKETGSGLGMLLVYDFVQKNNGNIWFKSKENAGSTFSFSLPLL